MEPYPEFFIKAASIRGVYENTSDDVQAITCILEAHGVHTILDLPCGFGRIASPLQAHGFSVTAVDASTDQIAFARRQFPGPDYQVGNMLHPPSGPFDAIINLYTSFGYMSSEDEDLLCLESWCMALRRGGILILETLDTERVASIDHDERHLRRDDGVFVRRTGPLIEHIHTDPVTRIMSIRYQLDSYTFTSRTRLYHRDQLFVMLKKVGFSSVEMFADFRRTPVVPASQTVFIAVR